MSKVSPRTARAVTALVALSGGATLAAEVLGSRLLRPLLGSTAVAQTGAVAGLLGSLGLGAWLTGRGLAEGTLQPARTLARSHALLALWCLVAAPASVALATPSARVLVGLDLRAPALATVVRVALALGVTALPGALAGSLYPCAVALLRRGAGAGTAWTGAVSSFAAAASVLVAVFALAPLLGVGVTMTLLAGVYALVAVSARRLVRTLDEPPAPFRLRALFHPAGWSPGDARTYAPWVLLGLASTGWQVSLSRVGVLSLGPSAYGLAAVTAGHVFALAAGEALAYRAVGDGLSPAAARQRGGRLAVWGGFVSALCVPLVLAMPAAVERALSGGGPSLVGLWSMGVGALVLAAAPVAATVGAVMAHAARSLATGDASADGAANGKVLLATAVGNVAGALGLALGVMPLAGVEGALGLAAACLALAGAVALGQPSQGVGWGRTAAVVCTFLAVTAWGQQRARRDPGAVLSGPFLYAGSREIELGRVAWRRDGREATVAVRRDDVGAVLLQIDGKVDATSVGDAATQTVVGIVPGLLARSPRSVFVIGLGSGMTADAARSLPGVRDVTVAELVPEVVRAAREDFAVANRGCLDDPRVRVLAIDAAHFLRGSTARYDVIVSEPSNPWVAGMSDLFTREAFAAAHARLNPGGALGVWFHAYSTSADAVASIVTTFRSVFPLGVLVEVTPGSDYLLVGLRAPYTLDMDAFLARAAHPDVAARLQGAGIDGEGALLARVLSGTRGPARVGEGGEVLTASSLTLEFRAPALLYQDATADVFARLARIDDLPLAGLGADPRPGGAWLRALDASEPLREAGVHARAMVLAERRGDLGAAITEGDLAVASRGSDLRLRTQVARLYLRRAEMRYVRRDPGGAEDDLTSVLELNPHPSERFRTLVLLGELALRRRDGQRALARYTEALGLARQSGTPAPVLRARRAEALTLLGLHDAARAELRAAGVRSRYLDNRLPTLPTASP